MSYLLGVRDNFPPAEGVDPDEPCCAGSAVHGPGGCTCWQPVYDIAAQADPLVGELAGAMTRPCSDCAYRKNSPERQGAEHVRGDEAFLDRIVAQGQPFWCHNGMRQVIGWEHTRTGIRIDAPHEGDYRPPIQEAIPYKADGTPGDLCAGWLARRLKHMQPNTTQVGDQQ